MPRRLLLHIGFPKTGSTAIQQALRASEERGDVFGFRFPHFDARWNHAYLAASYLPPKRWPRRLRSKYRADSGETSRIQENVRREFREWLRTSDALVISSEAFRRFGLEQVEAFRRDTVGAGPIETCVVAYVRDPADLYRSWIQQDVRAASSVPSPDSFRCNYQIVLEAWKGLGAERFEVRGTDGGGSEGPDVVENFFALTADFFERANGEGGYVRGSVHANQSMSAEAAIVLERYRRTYLPGKEHVAERSTDRLVRWLEKWVRSMRQTRITLRPDVVERVRDVNQSDLAYLKRDYGVELVRDCGVTSSGTEFEAQAGKRCSIQDVITDWDPEVVERLWKRVRCRMG